MLDHAVKDPISPALRLPVEITSEVFLHCLPTSYTEREWNTANPSEAPILLLHVCRIWREIAIGTPELWAKMEFAMDDAHSDGIAQAWFRRAKACPLSVKLHRWPCWGAYDNPWSDEGGDEDSSSDSDEEDDESISSIPIVEMLLEYAHNLRFLELSTIPSAYIRELDRLSGFYNFPSLQKLTIGLKKTDFEYWEPESMDNAPCIQLFRNAPLLRELCLIADTPPLFFKSLPWHQFTKYTGTTDVLHHCADALRLGSNLVECALTVYVADPTSVENLNHPSLKSLTLFNGWASTDIFEFLTLPALETLQILHCQEEWFSDQEFKEFLTRSSPPLRQFTLRLDHGTGLYIDAFLSMPSLVQLEIWNLYETFITDFFDYFIDGTFLPQLQYLSFVHPACSSDMDVAHRQLNEVQIGLTARRNSRQQGLVPLKSFCFVWDQEVDDLPEDDLAPLRAMASESLSITIKGATRSYI
ncbi:hypothetical protein C8R45DRAFT_1219485 [Mycena sanguinolenta]|nr:hypothetical protein C8R45DRAFT_1219485 [Mycena sanguinolenta]